MCKQGVSVLGLLIGSALATGCGFDPPPEIDDDAGVDAPVGGSATVDVTWKILDGYSDDGDNTGQCPADTTAQVSATRDGVPPYEVQFPCTAGEGSIADLPLGSYSVAVDLVNADGTVIYAGSQASTIDLLVADQTASAAFDIDAYNGFAHDYVVAVVSSADLSRPEPPGIGCGRRGRDAGAVGTRGCRAVAVDYSRSGAQ